MPAGTPPGCPAERQGWPYYRIEVYTKWQVIAPHVDKNFLKVALRETHTATLLPLLWECRIFGGSALSRGTLPTGERRRGRRGSFGYAAIL